MKKKLFENTNDIDFILFSSRVFLKVDNAALYTIYCHIENLEDLELEIRIVDESDGLIVFGSSRARGKTALIPIIFLDPNIDKSRMNLIENHNMCSYGCFTLLILNEVKLL